MQSYHHLLYHSYAYFIFVPIILPLIIVLMPKFILIINFTFATMMVINDDWNND
jgi:hypothetical protein